ncbi:MAG TPA: cytoplasmic protein [Rhizobiaceae bacterium]|nr:cytoplasmic protein [Rhizobiaceae bacterium]
MVSFAGEIDTFLAARKAASDEARQNAAFFLMSGLDLQEALCSGPEERRKILLRLERMIERERLKGSSRHWSYDLNRHIALKQVADRLRSDDGRDKEAATRRRQVRPRRNRFKEPAARN